MQVPPCVGSLNKVKKVLPGAAQKCYSVVRGRSSYAMSGMEGGVIERPTLPGLTPRYDCVFTVRLLSRQQVYVWLILLLVYTHLVILESSVQERGIKKEASYIQGLATQ